MRGRRNWGGMGSWKMMKDGEEEEGKMVKRAEYDGNDVGRRKRMKRVGRNSGGVVCGGIVLTSMKLNVSC